MPLNLTTDFQSFTTFKAAINAANTSGRPYNKTDIIRVWNLIAALQRFPTAYNYDINNQNLLVLLSVGSLNSLSSTLSRMRPMLSHLSGYPSANITTGYAGRIRFGNWNFVGNIRRLGYANYRTSINGQPSITSVQIERLVDDLVAGRTPTVTAAPRAAVTAAPVSQDTMSAARGRGNMLPMPQIIEDYTVDNESENISYYNRVISEQERHVATYTERAARYGADVIQFREGLAHMLTLETMPMNQLRTVIAGREYRTLNRGYNDGANCQCLDCRLTVLRNKVERYEQEIRIANREITACQQRIETYRREMPRFEPMTIPDTFLSLESFIQGEILASLAAA